ncbi:HNH endonuclease [Paraburkholderia bannensis]|nr:HNH endonuclease [Paraburkholderia bannensis]RQM49324.1 HNH endonuclease [Paraburkholderia bannensis]
MSQPPKSDNNALVPLAAENLSVKLPEPPQILTPEDAVRTRSAIMKHGAVTHDAKVAYERDGIATILATDKAGANKFVAERNDDEIIEDGDKVYILQPSIKKELDRRIAEPRDAYQLDRLRDAERCLDAVRDAPELENRRLKLEALARKQMPKVKRKVLKNADTCISGEPLQKDAEVHHKERVADNPNLALAPNNLVPVNPHIHDQIHAAQAHTPQALDELAKRQGWPQTSQQERE